MRAKKSVEYRETNNNDSDVLPPRENREKIIKKNERKNFNWAFGFNQLTLGWMGIWPKYQLLKKESLTVSLRTPLIILIIIICIFLPQMYALVLVIDKLPLVIENLMSSSVAFTSCFKILFLWLKARDLMPVIKSLEIDWLLPRPFSEHRIMTKSGGFARLITIVDFVNVTIFTTVFFILPFFGIETRLISNITDYGEHPLIIQSYYPYDYSRNLYFVLTYSSQVIAFSFLTMVISIPDTYFTALVFHMSAQFKILCNKVNRLTQSSNKNCKFLNKQYFKLRLKIVVDRHIHLMRIMTIVEQSFTYVIMVQVISTSMMLCFLGYDAMATIKGRNKESLIRMLLLFAAITNNMLHSFFICLASETLEQQSLGLFQSIYLCKWYTLTREKVQDLIPIMMLSKNTKKMTIGKIFHLSMETFSNLLKTTVGYISVLLTINK